MNNGFLKGKIMVAQYIKCKADNALRAISRAQSKNAQQSVHPTLEILAQFQAFLHASAFSQSDGVPPPAPARLTPGR